MQKNIRFSVANTISLPRAGLFVTWNKGAANLKFAAPSTHRRENAFITGNTLDCHVMLECTSPHFIRLLKIWQMACNQKTPSVWMNVNRKYWISLIEHQHPLHPFIYIISTFTYEIIVVAHITAIIWQLLLFNKKTDKFTSFTTDF